MTKKVKTIWEKLEPADVIAIIVVIGVIFLNWKGVQTMLTTGVAVIIGFYFGHKITKNGHS